MTARTAPDRPLTPEQLERELLARLGLPPASSSEDVDAAHRAVTAYLAHAPRELKDWARHQAAAADEAYSLLIDPAALADSVALVGPTARPAAMPGGPATPPARRDPSGVPAAVATEPTFEELLAEVTPSTHRDSAPTPNVLSAAAAPSTGGRRLGLGRYALVGGVIVGAIAIGLAGYNFGNAGSPGASPQPSSAAASAEPTIDQAAVAALMGKIQANPKDTGALMGLADEYFKVKDFSTAETWLTKLLAVDPKHVKGLLALGASQFNTGRPEEAKANWDKVVAIEPDNVEVHYDLGFYYFYQDPPDMAKVQAEWNRVVELAPDTDIARTVKSHLDALASPAPSAGASTAPSGSPAASPATSPVPSTSPAASPAASGSPQP